MHLILIISLEVVAFFALWRIALNHIDRLQAKVNLQSAPHPLNSDYVFPKDGCPTQFMADLDDIFWYGVEIRFCEFKMILYGLLALVACAVMVWIIV